MAIAFPNQIDSIFWYIELKSFHKTSKKRNTSTNPITRKNIYILIPVVIIPLSSKRLLKKCGIELISGIKKKTSDVP